ncbi:MAG: APC family permease [Candidatus Methanomethyliaceae archaeon]
MTEEKPTVQDGELEKLGYKQELKRVLGTRELLFYGIAMMVPIAPVAIYGTVTSVTNGHMAIAYLFAMLAMMLTARSYGLMAGAFPVTGSTYSYTQRSLNPHLGLLAGWAILLDYMLMPLLSYVVAANFGSTLLPNIGYWVWIVVALVIVTIVNIIGVKSLANVTQVLVVFMFLVLIYFVISAVVGLSRGIGAGTVFSLAPFYTKDTFSWSAIMAGTAIACFSFLGFDAVTTMSEEVRNPRRTISKATVLSCFIVGLLFILQAYLAQLIWPDFTTFPNLDSAFYFVANRVGGQALSLSLTLAIMAACLANALDAQAGAARLLYGMGRDGVIPKRVFAYLHPKTKTPVFNILLLAAVAIIGSTQSLETIVSMINFGALFGFTLVNLSVIVHYFIKKRERGGKAVLNYLVLPGLGALVCVALWASLSRLAMIVGFSWLGLGIIYAAVSTNFFRKQPPVLKEAQL